MLGLDDESTEAQKREALVVGWATWLRGVRWAYFATGTFTEPRPSWAVLEAVQKWLETIPKSYAAIGLQRGGLGHYHVHLLLGGVRRVPLVETFLRDSWRRGHLQIDGYHPGQHAVEYLVKQADEIELLGRLRPYRPHR